MVSLGSNKIFVLSLPKQYRGNTSSLFRRGSKELLESVSPNIHKPTHEYIQTSYANDCAIAQSQKKGRDYTTKNSISMFSISLVLFRNPSLTVCDYVRSINNKGLQALCAQIISIFSQNTKEMSSITAANEMKED